MKGTLSLSPEPRITETRAKPSRAGRMTRREPSVNNSVSSCDFRSETYSQCLIKSPVASEQILHLLRQQYQVLETRLILGVHELSEYCRVLYGDL